NQRHGVAGGDVDADRRLDDAEAADDEAERHADDDRERIADREWLQAFEQRRPELAGARERDAGLEDRGRIGTEYRGDVAAEELPGGEQDHQRAERDGPSRQRAARRLRGRRAGGALRALAID